MPHGGLTNGGRGAGFEWGGEKSSLESEEVGLRGVRSVSIYNKLQRSDGKLERLDGEGPRQTNRGEGRWVRPREIQR